MNFYFGFVILSFFTLSINAKNASESSATIVKKGEYPFMAYIFYLDENITFRGRRFFHSAILISPSHLITSAIDSENETTTIEMKTMIARMGLLNIEFEQNKDSPAQDREIIRIVRPSSHDVSSWWNTDITVVKVIKPFTLSPNVNFTTLGFVKSLGKEKACTVVIFQKDNSSVAKILKKLTVHILSDGSNCGIEYNAERMFCSSGYESKKDKLGCHDNNGGPLICDKKVIGIQNYPQAECIVPHLYQRLGQWENFVKCAIKDDCSSDSCASECSATDKDVSDVSTSDEETTGETEAQEDTPTEAQGAEIKSKEDESNSNKTTPSVKARQDSKITSTTNRSYRKSFSNQVPRLLLDLKLLFSSMGFIFVSLF